MTNPESLHSPLSNEETFAHSPVKTTRRVPQVRRLNLGLEVAFSSHSSTSIAWGCLCPLILPCRWNEEPLHAHNSKQQGGCPSSPFEPGSWGDSSSSSSMSIAWGCSLLTLPHRSSLAPALLLGKTPNCSTANLSDASPVPESPDSRACNSTFPSSFLGCTH
jgi:hypothetical protein